MAFRRKSNKLRFEFITANEEILAYEADYSTDLGNKLIKIGEDIANNEYDEDKQKEYLVTAYAEILGIEAMQEIKEKVFENEEFTLRDLVDIGMYIITVVEKNNQKIEETYKSIPTINTTNSKSTPQQIQELINGRR